MLASTSPSRLDAGSVIAHELGHALVFNGWINQKNGETNGQTISTYDRWVRWDGKDFYFDGPKATRVFGRPIILGHTVNNYHHVGEERPGVPSDEALKNDLMTSTISNGPSITWLALWT